MFQKWPLLGSGPSQTAVTGGVACPRRAFLCLAMAFFCPGALTDPCCVFATVVPAPLGCLRREACTRLLGDQPFTQRLCLCNSPVIGVSVYVVNIIQHSFLHSMCSGCICMARICHCVFLIPNKTMLDFLFCSGLGVFNLMLPI